MGTRAQSRKTDWGILVRNKHVYQRNVEREKNLANNTKMMKENKKEGKKGEQ
jgi:hypothetical protein